MARKTQARSDLHDTEGRIEGNKAHTDLLLTGDFELVFDKDAKKHDFVYFSSVDFRNLGVLINPSTGEYFADTSEWVGDGNSYRKTGFCEKIKPKELFEYPSQ